MVKLPGGFSPVNFIKQVGSTLNPTGGITDYDVYSDWTNNDTGGIGMVRQTGSGDDRTAAYKPEPAPAPTNTPQDTHINLNKNNNTPTNPRLNTAGINIANAKLGELDGLLAAALEADEQRYRNARGLYDQQETEKRGQFDEGVTRNTQNYDANLMASLRAGAGGIRQLMQLLRGSGGTAVERARDAVGDVTAEDIRSGYETNRENTESLENNLGTFLSELQRKRLEADDMRVNNERATRAGFDTQRQQLLNDLAGYYGEVGDTGRVNQYASEIAALQPSIAQNSRAQVSDYSSLAPVEVAAPEITAFRGASNPNIVTPGQNTGRLGTGIFTADPERRRREQLVGA